MVNNSIRLNKNKNKNRRKTVIRACSSCRRRKIKCSGIRPCTNCIKTLKACDSINADGLVTIDGIEQLEKKRKRALKDLARRNGKLSRSSTIITLSNDKNSENEGKIYARYNNNNNGMSNMQNDSFDIPTSSDTKIGLCSIRNTDVMSQSSNSVHSTEAFYDCTDENEPRSIHLIQMLNCLQNLVIQSEETRALMHSIKKQLDVYEYDWRVRVDEAKFSFFDKNDTFIDTNLVRNDIISRNASDGEDNWADDGC